MAPQQQTTQSSTTNFVYEAVLQDGLQSILLLELVNKPQILDENFLVIILNLIINHYAKILPFYLLRLRLEENAQDVLIDLQNYVHEFIDIIKSSLVRGVEKPINLSFAIVYKDFKNDLRLATVTSGNHALFVKGNKISEANNDGTPAISDCAINIEQDVVYISPGVKQLIPRQVQAKAYQIQSATDDLLEVLKDYLENYVRKVDRKKIHKPHTKDFSYGFKYFKTRQAANREANYLLAKNLLQDLKVTQSPADIQKIFSQESLKTKRNQIIKTNHLHVGFFSKIRSDLLTAIIAEASRPSKK